MATSLSSVGVFWTILSLLTAVAACVGYFMPYWLLGVITPNDSETVHNTSFGTFRRCGYYDVRSTFDSTPSGQKNMETSQTTQIMFVAECGRYSTFWDIPSIWWQVTTVVVGVGCSCGIVVAFSGLLCCCIGDAMSHKMALLACVTQLIAACCVTVGCVLYPLGWDSTDVKQVCGSAAHRFSWGSCSIGWAYWLTVGSSASMFICSWLACYSAKRKGGYQRTPSLRS